MTVEPKKCPFTILIDSNESQPWTFDGIKSDAKDDYRPIAIATDYRSLGRFPHSLGDYTIEGLEQHVAIERKSLEDCWSTVLGWENQRTRDREGTCRRERFKKELTNLAKVDASAVIVEATLGTCLANVPQWGEKPGDVNRRIFLRSVLAFMQDYKVPWLFCDSRRAAEVIAFRFLSRFHRKWKESNR